MNEVRFSIFRNFLLVNQIALPAIDSLMAEKFRNKVQTGPFKGMEIKNETAWFDGNMATKYVGAYEFELHDSIRKAVSRRPDSIINVGCAEGYYAVGLGRLLPYSEIHAMDMNNECLNQCASNARTNGIMNMVLVHGQVVGQDLRRGKGHRLYVVDIEGYELGVLDPQLCPELLESDIIVECHDFFYCDDDQQPTSIITDLLEQRFSQSHDVERITPRVPNLRDYPCLSGFVLGTALLAVTEKRPLPSAWLACWAKERRH